jgi:nicotinamidase-related amidase
MNNFDKTLRFLNEKVHEDGTETFQLDKGLTKKEADKQFKEKGYKFKKDHRGCHYDSKTGIIKFI